jgi:hypothetical protein
MTVQIIAYVNVEERAKELDCNVPTELALLPRNFDTAESKAGLLHESSVATIRTLWHQAGIAETKIEKLGDKFPYIQENAFEWVGPIIFASASLLSQNPHLISVALGVIANYLTDWFKGIPGDKKVRLDIVVERTKGKICQRIHYEGGPEGLNELAKVLREAAKRE